MTKVIKNVIITLVLKVYEKMKTKLYLFFHIPTYQPLIT